MRVLHFIDTLSVGGKERQLVELLKGLSQVHELDLLLICMDETNVFQPELRRLNIPLSFLSRKMRWDPFVFFRFYRIAKKFKPDIIHTNNWVPSFYAWPVAKLLQVKLINGSIRNSFSEGRIRWKLERLVLLLSDFRLANSKAGLRSRRLSVGSERNAVIYNGFDFSRLKNVRQDRDYIPGLRDRTVVGMVASFKNDKDYRSYILAAMKILDRRDDVVFLAVGDGETLADCKRLVPRSCDGIKFLGRRKDIEHIVASFDIGVLSTYTEGISNAIMEYMALGKPVVVTDGGGSNEIVVNEETGFLIPPENPGVLADKILFLLDHPEVGTKMGKQGKERLKSLFSSDRLVAETVKLYQHAAGDRKRLPTSKVLTTSASQ